MKTILGTLIALPLILMWGRPAALGGDKEPAGGVPQYNVKTELSFTGTIAKVTEVPVGQAYAGVHLTMQAKNDTFEVYLGPVDFIKMLDTPLRTGQKDVAIIGSKVKFEGNDLVLARELRMGNTVLSLRDEKGFPNWLWITRTDSTGF